MPLMPADLIPFSPTVGAAKAAFGCYCMIRCDGFDVARTRYTRATWYRHLRVLRKAGFTDDQLKHFHPDLMNVRADLPEGVVLVRKSR